MTGSRLLELVSVMDRLRSPGGCPWDAKQTHASLVEYLIEETYETVEAIDTGDNAALREELGDLLLQVVFHSRIGQEDREAPWDIDDVAGGITDKLISRHPHVFADATAATATDVEEQWQARKAVEKGRTSVTDGVPVGMPPTVQAHKLIDRARRGGVEVSIAPEPSMTWASQILAQLPAGDVDGQQTALGELLLALTGVAADRHLDAETAMRAAVAQLRLQIKAQESSSQQS